MSKGLVSRELEKLLVDHGCLSEEESDPDDIVLTYIQSVLDELQDDQDKANFDTEQFVSVMCAYFPELDEVESAVIYNWLFELVQKIKESKSAKGTNQDLPKDFSIEDRRGIAQKNAFSKNLETLKELFPKYSSEMLEKALKEMKGNPETTVEKLLAVKENSVVPKSAPMNIKSKASNQTSPGDDIKQAIISKYSFVDVKSDTTFHRPCEPKRDGKKMVRYRDGKVVSTRGEKYQENKKEESEDMKKTYVNLKPARKYRFH